MAQVDFGARYRVDGYRGIAFYLVGWAKETREFITPLCAHDERDEHDENCEFVVETEEVDSDQFVQAVMVGDNRKHTVDVENLRQIEEGDYCPECGQIGCTAYA